MHSKKKYNYATSTSQIKIETPTKSIVDFNSIEIKKQLEDVKKKIKEVMDNAQVDVEKLSTHFSI